MNILLINGPNLNLLGRREANLYGNTSLTDIEKDLESISKSNGCNLETMQSNAEHELIDAIHRSITKDIKTIIINPAAFTHTSIALRDAILGVNIPFYEVHISDVQSREEFRKFSYFSDIAEKVFSGLGIKGYELALLEATGVESSRRAKSCVNGDDKYPSCKCIFFTFKRSSCFTADKSAIPVAISILDELFPPSTQ